MSTNQLECKCYISSFHKSLYVVHIKTCVKPYKGRKIIVHIKVRVFHVRDRSFTISRGGGHHYLTVVWGGEVISFLGMHIVGAINYNIYRLLYRYNIL